MPGCMFQGCVNMGPGSGIVHQNHQANSSTTKNIKGIKALVQEMVLLLNVIK